MYNKEVEFDLVGKKEGIAYIFETKGGFTTDKNEIELIEMRIKAKV